MSEKIYTIDEIAAIIAPIARRYGTPAVYLFGSYARNEAASDSDIDLMVDTAGTDLTDLFALGALYSELEAALEKRIDLITVDSFDQTPVIQSESVFRENVCRERVKLYDVA